LFPIISFQFLIPSQATISTSIHILIPIHFVRLVANLQHKLHNIGIHVSA